MLINNVYSPNSEYETSYDKYDMTILVLDMY